MNVKEKKLLYIYGDSNTYGYDPLASCYEDDRLPDRNRWPAILQGHLKDTVKIIDDGQNGRCLPWSDADYERFQKALRRYEKLDYFAVMLGTNDLLNQSMPDPTEIADHMEGCIHSVKAVHTECKCIIITPPKMGFPFGQPMYVYQKANEELGVLYSETARKCNAAFVDAGSWELDLVYDGIHLSEKGHAQFAACMLREFRNRQILTTMS
jgi:lysophospholipase L1-like esterase